MRLEALHEIRAELVARLRARSAEIEDTVYNRVRQMTDPAEGDDPEYRAYLRATVAEGIDYALLGIERGEEWEGPIPEAAAVQARRAARTGVKLDAILRRYAAGDRLVGEFILDEASQLPNEAMRLLLRSQGLHVDRIMAAVASEYMDELERIRRSPAQRTAERVQRLLAADSPVDAAGLDYELDSWHLGLVVTGSRPHVAARTLAAGLERQALVVPQGEDSAWAWLGGRKKLTVGEVEGYVAAGVLGEVQIAVGEPRHGLKGWRLTHHEARAAQQVMLRRPQALTRASDVFLLAAVLRDELLAKSLHETYLAPLDEQGDAAIGLRETLRAYFDSGFNAATAAAALGVDRHTVQRRLRKVEEALGCLLHARHAEIAVALLLEEFEGRLEGGALGQIGEPEATQRAMLVQRASDSR
jgi:hypothetical protein